MMWLAHALSIFIGFASGLVVAGAVFAFITIVGIVPRLAQKTYTIQHIKIYESAIIAGGILGTLGGLFTPSWQIGGWVLIILGVATGIFYGCLAMSLAEVLDVLPIMTRRLRLERGMFYLVLAMAIGKMAGALLYFLVPGFYDPGAS